MQRRPSERQPARVSRTWDACRQRAEKQQHEPSSDATCKWKSEWGLASAAGRLQPTAWRSCARRTRRLGTRALRPPAATSLDSAAEALVGATRLQAPPVSLHPSTSTPQCPHLRIELNCGEKSIDCSVQSSDNSLFKYL